MNYFSDELIIKWIRYASYALCVMVIINCYLEQSETFNWIKYLILLIPSIYLIILTSFKGKGVAIAIRLSFLFFYPISFFPIQQAFHAKKWISFYPYSDMHKVMYVFASAAEGVLIIAILLLGLAFIVKPLFVQFMASQNQNGDEKNTNG